MPPVGIVPSDVAVTVTVVVVVVVVVVVDVVVVVVVLGFGSAVCVTRCHARSTWRMGSR